MKWIGVLCVLCAASVQAQVSVDGLLDLRWVAGDDTRSWLHEGLGKQRFDSSDNGLQWGQGIIEAKAPLGDTLSGKLVLNSYSEREHWADISEAYVQWKPLPVDGLRIKTRVGAFFPTLSLENTSTGWTSPWMLSSSAINTWVGEEFRTLGGEISVARPGMLHDSAHDIELIASVFRANDPAGGLLTWRGWSIGDRVTGLTESLPFPALSSVYGPNGLFKWQEPSEEPFREIDHRTGYYVGLNYGYNGWLSLRALHYDNRGNPMGFRDGQYAWDTVFDHLGLRVDLPQDITLLSQYMNGYTRMGRAWGGVWRGVNADYSSWYVLVGKAFDKHHVSVRFDKFAIVDRDHVEGDDNSEQGHGLAVNWHYQWDSHQQWGLEYLQIKSVHAGREYLDNLDDEAIASRWVGESNVQLYYRYYF